jgi:hypothetical protein
MEYVNLQTGLRIKLDSLTEVEKKFYRQALKRFHENAEWLAFDQFAFGMESPIYSRHRSHLEVLKDPLYLALKDMSLQLGTQQGRVARRQAKEKKRVA